MGCNGPARGLVCSQAPLDDAGQHQGTIYQSLGNLTSTLSWRSAAPPLFSKQNLPRKMQWLDLGLKLLVPVLLPVFLAISLKLGSLTVYFRLLNRQS